MNEVAQDYYALVRDVMANIKGAISTGEMTKGQESLTHYFADGVYGRQMDVVAGSLVVSKMHRHRTLNVFLKGKVSLINTDGMIELSAPCVLISPAGTQRIGFFHTDSSWLTIHPSDTQDLTEIEKQVIVPECEVQAFLENLGGRPCLGTQ